LGYLYFFFFFSPNILLEKYSSSVYIYKDKSVLFWNEVLKYQLNISLSKFIYLFAYLGQLWYFSVLFVIFSLFEFLFQSSILSFRCYHTLSK
jgi:hypothetical protein